MNTSAPQGNGSKPAGLQTGVLIAIIAIAALGWWVAKMRSTPSAPAPVPVAESVSHNDIFKQADELQRAGKLNEEAALLPPFIQAHPHDLPVRVRYASTLALLKKFDMAKQQYLQVLELDPNYTEARVGIARVTAWQGNYPAALSLYDEVLAKDPKDYEARVGKAYTLMWMKRDAQAKALFESAAADHPDDRDVADALANLRKRAKKG